MEVDLSSVLDRYFSTIGSHLPSLAIPLLSTLDTLLQLIQLGFHDIYSPAKVDLIGSRLGVEVLRIC